MTIRPATESDIGEILSLIRELAEFEEMGSQVECTADDLRRDIFGPRSVVNVSLVVEGDSVAGMALWFRSFSTFRGRTGIWLEDLFVREPFRRRGYGRDLLNHLRAQTDGRVEWDVLDWNKRAIDFYDSLGAKPVIGWTKYRWI